jgi:CBS domain-containing protein
VDEARSLMQPARTVSPELTVEEMARILLDEQLDGVCVVDDQSLLGVVTSMDLIFQEKRLHLPTFLVLFEAVVPLGKPKALKELSKITGSKVADVMTKDPVTVGPGAPLDRVATLMVEQHISIVPVVDAGRLLGVITKPAMLRAACGRKKSEAAASDTSENDVTEG